MEAHKDEECRALTDLMPKLDPTSFNYKLINWLWGFTLLCAVISSGLTIFLIYKHYKNYFKPAYQRWIVRILIMVPIYSFCSTLSFRFYYYSPYFDILRDVYEAFVIYSFYALLLAYLGDTLEQQQNFLQGKKRMKLPFPLNCFTFSPHGQAFLINTKILCLQYVVIRPAMAILSAILTFRGLLCPLSMSPSHAQFWIYCINFTSVSISMYSLVLLYIVIHHDIDEHKPFYKFVAVKFVVFFSFWQAIVIGVLEKTHQLPLSVDWTERQSADLIQNFLVCFEMIIASLLHIKAFSWKDFTLDNESDTTSIILALKDSISMSDIVTEIKNTPQVLKQHKQRRMEKRSREVLNTVDLTDEFADKIELEDIKK